MLGAATFAALGLAACKREQPEPQPVETTATASPASAATPSALPGETPLPQPSVSASAPPSPPPAKLDLGALQERTSPERVLRFYAAALQARDWRAAARAWGSGAGVTPSTLKAAYDRPAAPSLEIGEGEGDAGAGSLFYEAPVILRFGPGAAAERGTLTLRRVNDVDGATPDQLRWHIERSTIGAGQ
jgi:type IV secretory pathway VirB10-like protein